MLAPGGRIVFADFLLTGREDDFCRTTLLPELVCPSYETFEGYRGLLEDNGFVDIQADDVSEQYASYYRQAMVRIDEARDWIAERYSARVYDIVVEKNGYASVAFDIGQARFLEPVQSFRKAQWRISRSDRDRGLSAPSLFRWCRHKSSAPSNRRRAWRWGIPS